MWVGGSLKTAAIFPPASMAASNASARDLGNRSVTERRSFETRQPSARAIAEVRSGLQEDALTETPPWMKAALFSSRTVSSLVSMSEKGYQKPITEAGPNLLLLVKRQFVRVQRRGNLISHGWDGAQIGVY